MRASPTRKATRPATRRRGPRTKGSPTPVRSGAAEVPVAGSWVGSTELADDPPSPVDIHGGARRSSTPGRSGRAVPQAARGNIAAEPTPGDSAVTDTPNILTAIDGAVATVTISPARRAQRPHAVDAGRPRRRAAERLERPDRSGGRPHRRGPGVQLRRRPQVAGGPLARRRLGRRRARPPCPPGHRAAHLHAQGRRGQGQRLLLHRRPRAGPGLRPDRRRRRGQVRRHPRQVRPAAHLGHEPAADPPRRAWPGPAS